MFSDPWKITAAQQALLTAGQEYRIQGEAYRQAWIAGELWMLQHPDEAKKAKSAKSVKRLSREELKAVGTRQKKEKKDGPSDSGG